MPSGASSGWATLEMAEEFAKLAKFMEEVIGGHLVDWGISQRKKGDPDEDSNCFTFGVKRFVDTEHPYAEISFFPCNLYYGSLGIYGESSDGINQAMNSMRISLYIDMPVRAMLGKNLDTLIEMVNEEVGYRPHLPDLENPSPWYIHIEWKIYEGGKRL